MACLCRVILNHCRDFRVLKTETPTIILNHYIFFLIEVMRFNRALGRAIAQAVSRRLPTAAARVRVQVRSSGICGGKSGTGAGFLRILRFPLPILIPSTASYSSSSIIRGWNNRSISGRCTKWTQSHPHFKKLKKN
jgi:hypothetical protein